MPDFTLPPSPSPRDDGPLPTQVGPYRIVERLGAGGMGEVYVAEQTEPVNRRVALKVIKLGMDSREIVARFQQERQALALMAHDGIAKIYDVGTTERGQPYFVMEYVKGLPLHDYCDAHQLGLEERIALLQQVCAAVTHAHQKGVVHRDLKPGNVLVADNGGVPQAKVIDFGLAKALGPKIVDATLFTEAGRIVGTPEYMAPEQADPANVDIDTRVDVYSLGVMLYEVLVGRLPFASERLRRGGVDGILQVLRHEEPPRPSQKLSTLGGDTSTVCAVRRTTAASLQKALRTDLDWVVLKAMEKDRSRRYDSPAALAAELQRYLDHEPLLAGPPSAWYRLQKLARRYRGQFVAAGLVGVTLVAGSVGTLVQWRRAESARADAVRLAAEQGRTVDRFNQLSGLVRLQDVRAEQQALWLSAEDREGWPEKVEALQGWLTGPCAELLSQRQAVEAVIAELRAKSLPLPAEQIEAARRASPGFQAWDRQRKLVVSLRRAQAIRTGAEPLLVPEMPKSLRAASALDKNAFAWARVAPERLDGGKPDRTVFGEEGAALVAARAAVASSVGDPHAHDYLDTLAWAALANGQDDEARRSSIDALVLAPLAERAAIEASQRAIVTEIAAQDRVSAAEARLAELTAKVDAQRVWTFARDEEGESARFLHDALIELLAGMQALAVDDRPDVELRLAWAKQVAVSARHPRARVTWAEARAAIAKADDVVASAAYAGCAIPMPADGWPGLVPIGMNPATKLWEFYDLRSAWDGTMAAEAIPIPQHLPDGSIPVDATTGIVFVLLPGGRVTIGSQSEDPDAPFYDSQHEPDETLRTIDLAPFLLARHEMTQAQWARLWTWDPSRRSPSGYRPDRYLPGPAISLANPVELVDWDMCDRLVSRHGMVLPTEAQWEYACRAGTTTPWHVGVGDLGLAANLADSEAKAHVPGWTCEEWSDGHIVHAAPGSFLPNAFGLYDMHGNVWEWCRDLFGLRGAGRPGDGLQQQPDSAFRSIRGGCFGRPARFARAADRNSLDPNNRSDDLGVRAARLLSP